MLDSFLRRLDREEADVQRYNSTLKKAVRTRCEMLIESLEGARERQLEIAEMREEEVRSQLRSQRAAASLAIERLQKAKQDGGRARGELERALLSRDDLHQHTERVRHSGISLCTNKRCILIHTHHDKAPRIRRVIRGCSKVMAGAMRLWNNADFLG